MVEGHTNWTTMFLQILFLICSVCNTYGVASTASPSCTSDEYRAGQVCCLACPGGYRVHRDCTATLNTLCSKCPDDTFKEGLSGQKQCSACTKCVRGQKVKKCTPTSDAECEIPDGFFCSISADKDTFSEATSSCQPHTICDSGVQIQPGTDSTDSTCFKYVAIAFIIIGCICFIILLFLGALFYRWLKMERDLTELEKQIDELETPGQDEAFNSLWEQLHKKKMKTPKQKWKLVELTVRCVEKVKTPELDLEFNEWIYREQLEITQKENTTLNVWIVQLLKREEMTNTGNKNEKANLIREKQMKKKDLDRELTGLIDQLLKETKEQERKITVLTDCPEPTRDQQEHTITIPSATMDDDQDDDQSLGRAPPSSSTHNGSESVSVHHDDDQPVPIKRDSGASRSPPLSLGPPSPSQSTPLSLGPPSPSRSTPLSLMRSSTSQSAGERVSLLMDNDVAEAEVTPVHENRDQPGRESDDSNSPTQSLKKVSCSPQVGTKFPRDRVSLLMDNDVAEEEVTPVQENLDPPES